MEILSIAYYDSSKVGLVIDLILSSITNMFSGTMLDFVYTYSLVQKAYE